LPAALKTPLPTNTSISLSPVGGALPPTSIYSRVFLRGTGNIDNARFDAETAQLDADLKAVGANFDPTYFLVNWFDHPNATPLTDQWFEIWRVEPQTQPSWLTNIVKKLPTTLRAA